MSFASAFTSGYYGDLCCVSVGLGKCVRIHVCVGERMYERVHVREVVTDERVDFQNCG